MITDFPCQLCGRRGAHYCTAQHSGDFIGLRKYLETRAEDMSQAKAKLSETEREEIKKIKERIYDELIETEGKLTSQFAYDIGYVFGILDRLTQ